MAEEQNHATASWGATVDAPTGPALPAAMSPALSANVEARSRVRRVQTAAEAMAEAKAAAATASLVDDRLVTSERGDDVPQTEATTSVHTT